MPGAHKAKSALTFMKPAKARTEVALDAAIVKLVPIPGAMRSKGLHHEGESIVTRLFCGWLCVARACA